MIKSTGGLEQLLFLRNKSNQHLTKLSDTAVTHVIHTPLLSTGEKLELLEMQLDLRLLTEASTGIKYNIHPRKDGFKYPLTESIQKIERFVSSTLGLPIKRSAKRSNRSGKYVTEINIFASETLKDYFTKYEKGISAHELGLLYGYHPKAILAFCGYIPRLEDDPPIRHAYQYYNSMVYPADFYDEVDQYHKYKWERLKQSFPEIIAMAEEEFAAKIDIHKQ